MLPANRWRAETWAETAEEKEEEKGERGGEEEKGERRGAHAGRGMGACRQLEQHCEHTSMLISLGEA